MSEEVKPVEVPEDPQNALDIQMGVFNSPLTQSSINWLLANGFSYGKIIVTILANLPKIREAIQSGKPLEVISLLLSLLGSPTNTPSSPAMIGQ